MFKCISNLADFVPIFMFAHLLLYKCLLYMINGNNRECHYQWLGGVVLVPYDIAISLVNLQNTVGDTHHTLHSGLTLRVSTQIAIIVTLTVSLITHKHNIAARQVEHGCNQISSRA